MKTKSNSRLAFFIPRVLIGFVLCVAGIVLALAPVSSAEDNATAELSQSVPAHAPGRWTATGRMLTARYIHTATLLPNGQVLVAGGFHNNALAKAELYDPATGVWTATGRMVTQRTGPTATLLPNGQVLVAGGSTGSAELYDPATGMWTATKRLGRGRYAHMATLLLYGNVLVSGGFSRFGVLAHAQLYKSAPEMLDSE